MTSSEQENYLVKKFQECCELEREITKMLARIRGGERVQIKEIDRPDEALLKGE
jgi:hypothetical protein